MGDCEQDVRQGENRCKSSSEFPFDKSMEVDSTSEDIEHLGSINHCNEGDGTNLRSSARVSKKMRLDSVTIPVPVVAVVPVAAPVLPQEKKGQDQIKEEEKADQKQPVEPKPKRRPIELWSHEDKNTFFEALNEFGKDFDAIQNHFAVKAKKKGMIELAKTKDQIRHFYYRTWHKVSKHLKFPEDLKKVTQEIYALVNYGEMRKKVSCITEKTSVKLNELISKGFTLIRLRGKTIRIRTPMCRALRKLNQLEELQEELKLPQRVIIELRPRDTETWAKVQATSQNPRARTTLPLQRRLSTLLSFLQYRWRPHHQKHRDKLLDSVESNELPLSMSEYRKEKEPLLRLAPLSGANICMPSVNLNEYLTSFSLCLTAHEERRATWAETGTHAPVKCGSAKKGTKRQPKVQENSAKLKENEDKLVGSNLVLPMDVAILDCNACDNDKKTFEKMLGNVVESVPDASLGTSNSIDEAVNHILSLNQEGNPVIAKDALPPDRGKTEPVETDPEPITPTDTESKVDIVKETIERIRKGWTIKDAHAVSVGELYLMFGSDSKIQLEYWWEDLSPVSVAVQKTEVSCTSEPKANKLAVTLQKLLSVAKLNLKKTKLICPCGHVCGAGTKTSKNRLPVRLIRASGEINEKNKMDGEGATYLNNRLHPASLQSLQDGVFRRPLLAPSQYKMMPKHDSSVSDFKAQLDKFRPRYCNRRGRSVRSKNVVVQRMLPLLPKAPNGHAMVTLKVIPQTSQLSGEFMPITSPSASVVSFPALGRQRSVLPKVQQAPSVLSPSIKSTVIDTNSGVIETSTNQAQSSQEKSASPSEISSLLKLDIPSTASEIALPVVNNGRLDVSEPSTSSFVGLLPSEGSLQISTSSPPSPTRILKEDENQWLNSEVADFSLSSFLGHLESPMKSEAVGNIIQGGEDTRMSSDVEAQLQCLMSENSIDYMAKFADLAAQIASDGTNKK